MAHSAKNHYIVLDGLRGIAALMVGALHSTQVFHIGHRPAHAYLAVDFFFCLSGFVVALAYDKRLGIDMTFGDFVVRRLIRLYPMIFIGTALAAIVAIITHTNFEHLTVLVAGCLLLLPTGLTVGLQAFALNNPIWSLCFEFVANGVYAIFTDAKRPQRNNFAMAVLVFFAACLAATVLTQDGGLTYVGFNSWALFGLGFFRVAYPFLAGMLIYRLKLHHMAPKFPAFILVAALIILLVLPFKTAFYDLICVLLVVPGLLIISPESAHSARFEPAWIWSGRISYPFYLVHVPILFLVNYVTEGAAIPKLAIAAFSLLLALITSTIVVLYLDEPIRRSLSATLIKKKVEAFG
jgi:peptidoglycan/LPS O-acetylase OafA/YrhL